MGQAHHSAPDPATIESVPRVPSKKSLRTAASVLKKRRAMKVSTRMRFGNTRPKSKRRIGTTSFAWTLLALCFLLLPATSQAQVATHSLYQGQLTDAAGVPRAGPVNLRLQLYAADSGGAALYSEDHAAVALDAQGMFAVALGGGSVLSGSYDAALLERPPLYLELVVEPSGENVTLTPRQRLGAVPSARVAGEPVRFEDCGDGTVADHQTGLLWEKKTGTFDQTLPASGICETAPGGCPDPHDVNNRYKWSSTGSTGTEPDGNAYTDFLARLNGDPTVVAATSAEARGDPADDPNVCLAHRCDWRLLVITELTTILVGSGAAAGQSPTCLSAPCIDPGFAAVGGPTASSFYWSASTNATNPRIAWNENFNSGDVSFNNASKTNDFFVRAVRAGSCN